MQYNPTIDNLITFIREHQRIPARINITPATRLEDNLGITGDDGSELLEALEKQFDVSFKGADGTLRTTFGLEEDEHLFHSEGIGFFNFIARLFARDLEKVRPLTVKRLFHVISSLKQQTHS